jgi:hypothetical protein
MCSFCHVGSDEHTDRVKTFVDGIPKDTLGLAAFKCQAYTRSLMYLEMFLSGSHPVLEEHLGFLQVCSSGLYVDIAINLCRACFNHTVESVCSAG